MFEKEIKFIVDYTLNKLRKEVAHVNMGRLLGSSIHPALIKYCSAEIDNQIKSDRNKLLTNSFFDYSGSEITKYFNQISEEIKQNYKMKNEDLKKLIIKATSFNTNYVIRPGWTLAKFIFNEEKERSIKDVLSYFNYVYYYDYQIRVLSAFLQKRKADNLTRDEFILLTSKIDKEVITSNKREILRDGVISIADFFNEGGTSRDKVSPYLIEYYLKDKKFTEASDVLKTHYGSDDKQKQPVKDILARLSSFIKEEIPVPEEITKLEADNADQVTTAEEINPVIEPPQVQQASSSTDSIRIIPVNEQEDYQSTLQSLLHFNNEQKKNDIPENPQTEEESPSEENLISEEVELDTLPQPIVESNDIQEIPDEINEREEFAFKYYIKEEEKKTEPPVKNRRNDIFDILSKRETAKITESIFSDDENEFVSTMDKILECGSFEEASGIMKKLFQSNRVNPYSKDAILFTTAIANFFNQE